MSFEDDDDLPPQLVDINDLQTEVKSFDPVPVTIVTGYLGSGKSTLLKHILQSNHGKRIALILNEFGQTSDIEKSLNIRNSDTDGSQADQWVELDNGCMCCTAKDSGVAAIEKLMERQGRYDYIIIETSGVADPAPIAGMFWLDDALQSKVKLDGVVTVVDAHTIMKSLSEGELASLQIACSDVILINKCDLASEEQISEIEAKVHSINGAARTARCQYGSIGSGELILDLDAYSNTTSLDLLDNVHGTESRHSHSNHGLSTVVVKLPSLSAQQLAEVESKLQHILWEGDVNGHSVVVHRLKGKLQVAPAHTKILQGVRETYEITDVKYEPEGVCKLVFIGKGLADAEPELRKTFETL